MTNANNLSRREQILDVAAQLFSCSGPEALSVRRVAEAAEVGMGTLRHYFPKQNDLLNAVILKLVDDQIEDFEIYDAEQTAAVRLEKCVRQFVPDNIESMPLLAIWFGMYRMGLEPNGSLFAREFLSVSSARARQRIRSWLTVLAEEGAIAALKVDYHTVRLLVLVNGICLELMTPGTELELDTAHQLISQQVRETFQGRRK
jgi:AcrR family transcriptional regulator